MGMLLTCLILLSSHTKLLYLQIVVEAKDQTLPASLRLSTRKSLVISITDVNDNAPEFVSPPAGEVLENSASGTEVMTVRARDKYANRNGQVGYVAYSVITGVGRNVSCNELSHDILITISNCHFKSSLMT